MGKSKIRPIDNSDPAQFLPPTTPETGSPAPSQFSQLNTQQNTSAQAIRDHLVVVMAWNGLKEQMNLDNQSKQQSDDINNQINNQ